MPDLKIVTDLFTQLFSAKPEILLVIAIIFFGYVLKTIPQFPNRLIPAVNLLIGMIAYPLIDDRTGAAPYTMRYPVVREIMIGLIIGCAAHYVHAIILKPWLDKFLPLAVMPNGDTKLIRKDSLTPPDDKG